MQLLRNYQSSLLSRRLAKAQQIGFISVALLRHYAMPSRQKPWFMAYRSLHSPKAAKQVTLLLPFYLLLYLWAEALFAHGPKALLGP